MWVLVGVWVDALVTFPPLENSLLAVLGPRLRCSLTVSLCRSRRVALVIVNVTAKLYVCARAPACVCINIFIQKIKNNS